MSRRVLLIDPDLVALGALASALRGRDFNVINASEPFEAVEQAFQLRPDVVLHAAGVDTDGQLTQAFRGVPELSDIPLLRLVDGDDASGLADDEVLRSDILHVVARIRKASPHATRLPVARDIRGNVEQVPPVDLLQLLAMNRRSGALCITTAGGAGEVRMLDGEVVDAVFRQLEGEKALYRLLGQREGHFVFVPGQPSGPRRIERSTSMLLMEAMRLVDELSRRRVELSPDGETLAIVEAPARDDAEPAVTQRASVTAAVASLLRQPRTIDELLDELAAPDLEILDGLTALANSGRIRRLTRAMHTTPLAPADAVPALRLIVSRLHRRGFALPARLVIAAAPALVGPLALAVRSIADAAAAPAPPTDASLPRPLATLRLGEGVELALVGLPADESFAPLWALTLPGAAAVVRLAEAGGATLEAHCQAAEVPLVEAESVMGTVDVASPSQLAALVRSVLELVPAS